MSRLRIDLGMDKTYAKKSYLQATFVTGGLATIFSVVLWFFTENFFLAVFGENWIDSIKYIKYLMIVMIFQSMSESTKETLLFLNKQSFENVWALVAGLATIVPFAIAYLFDWTEVQFLQLYVLFNYYFF